MRLPLALALFAAAILAAPATVFADEEPDADVARRAIARQTVLVEWSLSAKTASLGLSEEATRFLDLWLDFCRSKHARRTRPSTEFRGVPHAAWEAKDGSALVLRIAFASLEIEKAELTIAETPAVLGVLTGDRFTQAVTVEGDKPRWLRIWAVMLASEVVDRAPMELTAGPLTKARQSLCEHLVRTFDATEPLPEGTIRIGGLESERLVWLLGVRATGCAAAGQSLCSLYDRLKSRGLEQDAGAAAEVIAGCPGAEAEAFAIDELKSEDWERQLKVLSGAGSNASPTLLKVVSGLTETLPEDEQAQMAFIVLQRAAQEEAPHREVAARLLREQLRRTEGIAERRTMAAMALAQSGNADADVVAYVEAYVAHLEATEAHAGRVAFMKRVLTRARTAIAARAETTAPEGVPGDKEE
jgi:hypothetical protein